MASPLQQASTRRKLIYFGVIAAIFTLSMFWRGVIKPPGESLAAATLVAKAEALELRELERGDEADLSGATVRLLLSGSRGLAVSGLWWAAHEKQKRHEWNDMELLVRSITKLQPHFINPWLFQSWNISYNVSVESERLNDMYFFISRGIELLAEGERLNRNNPDLRYWIGFYYQNKFGVADKVVTLRSLFQVSCIPPAERNPDNFWIKNQRGEVEGYNKAAFRRFCEAHPQLVRRLRESALKIEDPMGVIEFLAANTKIPTRFTEQGELAPPTQQFPILPALFDEKPFAFVEKTNAEPLDDTYDPFMAARAWHRYAQKPLPPTDPNRPTAIPTGFDRQLYRLPKQPAVIIFRQGPPRAQTYLAERLQKEGWFDDKEGWRVHESEDTPKERRWFPDDEPGTVVLGRGVPLASSQQAWRDAYTMWDTHGQNNALHLSVSALQSLRNRAELLERISELRVDGPSRPPSADEAAKPELLAAFDAHRMLDVYRQNLQMTNFEWFLFSAQAEMDPDAVFARKKFHEADRLRKSGLPPREPMRLYEEGFEAWKKVLMRYPSYRNHPLLRAQEDTYDLQLQYMSLVREDREQRTRAAVFGLRDLLTHAHDGLFAYPWTQAMGSFALLQGVEPALNRYPIRFVGPFDGLDDAGNPWVGEHAKSVARQRFLEAQPHLAPSQGPPPGAPAPPQPPTAATPPG